MDRKTGRFLLLKVLQERGLSQRAAGKIVGANGSVIAHWCSGRSRPSRRLAMQLWKTLGVPIESWDRATAPTAEAP